MSRFDGYGDDCDQEPGHWYRIDVERAFRSKPGQDRIRQMCVALDAMPVHELIAGELRDYGYTDEDEPCHGQVCTLGAFAAYRFMQADAELDFDHAVADLPDENDQWLVADWMKRSLNFPFRMAQHIEWVNDEELGSGTPEDRWLRMRAWLQVQLSNPDPWRCVPLASEARSILSAAVTSITV